MKIKQYLIMALGVVLGAGVSIAGVSTISASNNSKVNLITSEKAKKIMINKVPGGTILEFSYDNDDRVPKYDGTLIKNNFEYEIDVNAKTGEIIKFEKEKISISNTQNKPNVNNNSNNTQNNSASTSNTNSYIGESKARSIMQNKAPGAKFISFYLENDNTPEYEGKLVKGNTEYEISVNAKTGAITEFSTDYIKTVQNNNNNQNNSASTSNTNSYIGESKARSIMQNKAPGAKFISFYLENDNTPEYEGKLVKGNTEYEISVNAKTGVITEFSTDYIKTVQNNGNRYDDDRYDDDDDDDDRYDDDRYDDDDDDRYDD